jgi:hypothetical protein
MTPKRNPTLDLVHETLNAPIVPEPSDIPEQDLQEEAHENLPTAETGDEIPYEYPIE